jgi:hypothetical protein
MRNFTIFEFLQFNTVFNVFAHNFEKKGILNQHKILRFFIPILFFRENNVGGHIGIFEKSELT